VFIGNIGCQKSSFRWFLLWSLWAGDSIENLGWISPRKLFFPHQVLLKNTWKKIILPLTAVNYRSTRELYTTIVVSTAVDSAALKCSYKQSINCDFAYFGQKIKINRELFEMLRFIIIKIENMQSSVAF